MCGRFAMASDPESLARFIELFAHFQEIPPRLEIAPTQQVAVVRTCLDGPAISFLKWGLVPSWSPEPRTRTLLINARAEGIFDRPSFRAAARSRRCLVPASGFYEWEGAGRQKQAWFFRPRETPLMAFAGIWERWEPREPETNALFPSSQHQPTLETFAIITTTANATVSGVHDRMPVILRPQDFDRWLDPRSQDISWLGSLLVPAPDDYLEATRVNPRSA